MAKRVKWECSKFQINSSQHPKVIFSSHADSLNEGMKKTVFHRIKSYTICTTIVYNSTTSVLWALDNTARF